MTTNRLIDGSRRDRLGPGKEHDAEMWGSAPWERIEHLLAPIHAHILSVLPVGPRVHWLDLATGTGAVALRAARAGAHVTGLDLAPRLIQTARRRARAEGLHIRFDVGDAEALPYPDASFDAISSAMGIIFAPDHQAIARELARLCRPAGMIAFSAWREGGGWTPVTRRYFPAPAPGEPDPLDWGTEHHVQAVLGEAFDIRFEEGNAPVTGASGEKIWQLAVSASGPFKARVGALDQHGRERLHREFVEYLDGHRQNGLVHIPAPYVMTIGIRRA